MKNLITFALLLSALVFFSGCQDDQSVTRQVPQGQTPARVSVVMSVDTLCVLSPDTAGTPGYVVVTDENGLVIPRIPVALSLSDVNVGMLNFRTDTTDAHGQVAFRFIAQRNVASGHSIVRAHIGSVQDSSTVWIRRRIPGHMDILLQPDSLHTSQPAQDSIHVTVTLRDTASLPIAGAQLSCQAVGNMSGFAATNAQGMTSTWWMPGQTGTFWIYIQAGILRDSAAVLVDTMVSAQIGSLSLLLTSSYLYFYPGDSLAILGWATVRNAAGQPLAGRRVSFAFSNPLGHLVFSNPALHDTSDANGRVEFTYWRNQIYTAGFDTVWAICSSHSAQQSVQFTLRRPIPAALHLIAQPDTLLLAHGATDSVLVTATLLDSALQGIPNIPLSFLVSSGATRSIPPTDIHGRTSAYWYFSTTGRLFVTSRVWILSDTAWVQVDSSGD